MTKEESFETVNFWIENTIRNNGKINEQYELFLVANKIDENEIRKVGKNKGKELATKYNIKYFEISCLKKINIYELLYEITLMAYKKNKTVEQADKANEKNKENKPFQLNKNKNVIKKKKKSC